MDNIYEKSPSAPTMSLLDNYAMIVSGYDDCYLWKLPMRVQLQIRDLFLDDYVFADAMDWFATQKFLRPGVAIQLRKSNGTKESKAWKLLTDNQSLKLENLRTFFSQINTK